MVKSAREEHRAAIEWLNNNTVDGVGFFLVEIQLWQIDGSALAPRLNVVEQPNDWAKIAKQPSGNQGGAAAQFKYEYWSAFSDYAFKSEPFSAEFNYHKASSNHWYNLNIGSAYSHISLLVNTKTNVIAVEFAIPNNKELYDRMETHKKDIDSTIGISLDWRRLDDKKACRILLEKTVPLKDSAKWNEQFDWLMQYAILFKTAFAPYL